MRSSAKDQRLALGEDVETDLSTDGVGQVNVRECFSHSFKHVFSNVVHLRSVVSD